MAILLDIEPLHECACNHGIDLFYKAGSEPPDDKIWEEHPSPFVRRLVEMFTQRGLTRLSYLQLELAKWINHETFKAGEPRQPRPEGAMERWTPGELALARLYLETVPPEEFALDDWMMVIEYLTQRYLPLDDLRTEAEWLSVKSTLMGRVQASMEDVTERQADKLLAAMPNTVHEVEQQFTLNPRQRAVLDYGRTRCADYVTAIPDSTRRRLRRLIVDHQEAVALGDRGATAHSLETKLHDEFSVLNRDWRRIAVTEAGEMANQGMIASLPEGSRVKRLEHYEGACAFCRKIDGMEFDVVTPDAPDKDGWKQVWVGKTNVGRSAAPRMRVGGTLVPRPADELWQPAAGTQHPHCRGAWLQVTDASNDPDFAAWLEDTLKAPAKGISA